MFWVYVGLLIGIATLLYFLVDSVGKIKKFISFIKSNRIEFRIGGETLTKIMENVPGHILKKVDFVMDTIGPDGKIISSKSMEVERFFPLKKGERKKKHFLGIYPVGPPPYYKILEYTFSWDKAIMEGQKEKEEKKGRKVELSKIGQFVSHASEKVSSLLFTDTYYILVPEVELIGQVKVTLAFNVKIEVEIPIIPIIILNGKWLAQFSAIFVGIITDYLRNYKIDQIESMDKGAILSALIYKNNESRFIKVTGMKASDVAFIGFDIAGSSEVQKAATAGEVGRLLGEGVIEDSKAKAIAEIEKATAAARSRILKGDADAYSLNKLMEEARKYPGGVEILKQQLQVEGLAGFKGNVLVLNQGNTSTSTPLQISTDGAEKKT